MTQTNLNDIVYAPKTLPDHAAISIEAPANKVSKPRLTALDALRGLTIFLMLLVNNVSLDSQTPPQLMHAQWNLGLHLADLVFPWFLFCVGVAVPFSYASFLNSGRTSGAFVGKAAIRAGILVALGCLLDSAIDHQLGFGLGVLQLIGLAYFIGSVGYLTHPWLRVLFGAVLLAAYGFALQHIAFPGAAAGVLDESSNLIRHINNTYLAQYNLQGLLSAIPTAGLVLYGTLMGDVLKGGPLKVKSHAEAGEATRENVTNRIYRDGEVRKMVKLLSIVASGAGLIAVGDVWSVFLPYNKPVWTPPYLLVCGGLGALLLAAFYLVLDIGKQKWLAYPLVVFGSNAIAAYVVPIFVKVLVLDVWMTQTPKGNMSVHKAIIEWLKGNYGAVPGGWTYTIGYILVWWIVLWFLYRKRWFLRV